MAGDELAGVVVGPLDERLELVAIHPPLAATADLHGDEVPAAHQRIGLSRGDVQDLGDVGEAEEPRLGHVAKSDTSRGRIAVAHSAVPTADLWTTDRTGVGGPRGWVGVPRIGGWQVSDGSPPARRLAAARWLDLRLVLGVLLVLLAVVIGARVFASAGRYSQVYVARQALVPGERVDAADLGVGRVRFDGAGGAYVAAAGQPPVGYVVTRYVGAHELVPMAALSATSTAADASRVVTVPVAAGHLPDGLAHGDLVDVYLTPKVAPGRPVPLPTCVLSAAAVQSDDGGSQSLTAAVSVAVELAVPQGKVPTLLHAVESGSLDLVRVPPDAPAAPLASTRSAPS